MLYCGFHEIVITPPLSTMIPGQFEQIVAMGIKDELYAKAAVFKTSNKTLCIITIDALEVTKTIAQKIKDKVSKAININPLNIMVSATHTHTGPQLDIGVYNTKENKELWNYLCEKVADSAILAFRKLEKSQIGFSQEKEDDISFIRRFYMKDGTIKTNPGFNNENVSHRVGEIDNSVSVIRVDSENDKTIGLIVNFACHPDVVGGNEFSADFPGELSRQIKKALGDNVVTVFLNGCCGDINHVDFLGEHPIKEKHHIKMGQLLSTDVLKAYYNITLSNKANLNSVSTKFLLKRRQPTNEDIVKSQEALNNPNETYIEKTFAKEILELAENKILEEEAEVLVFKIGDIAITSLPGEMFSEIGLKIKSKSPFKNNMIVELANHSVGYVPTSDSFNLKGSYETRLSKYTFLETYAADVFIEKSVNLLNSLY